MQWQSGQRRQAEATWRRKQGEEQKRREEEERRAREAAYAAQTAAEHQQWLSWSERQRQALKAYKPPMDYEALRRNLPAYQPAQETKKPWWKKAGDWFANRFDDAKDAIMGARDALAVRHLRFNRLADGHISVRAETPPGTRLAYRRTVANVMNSKADEFFAGTRYNPSTVAARTAGGLWRSAWSKGNIALAGVTSLASNLWTFGTNPEEGATFWDRTVKNREFWVSTVVDFAVSVAVGVAAAAVVAGTITALVAAGITAAATAPLWVTVGATAIISIGIGLGVDALGIPKFFKDGINGLFE